MIAIGFDFDHTLGVDHALERRAFEQYARELGRPLDADEPDAAAEVDTLLARFRAGETTCDQMIAGFARVIGVAGARAERWRAICYALVDELVEPLEGARETVAALRKRGIPLAVLTNGWTPLQQKKIARALGGEAIGTILVSDALHAIKPARRAFDALVEALGVPRSDIWYVGDNVRADVAGALAAGLNAVWFDWEGQSYPQDVPPPTLRITRLRELAMLAENAIAP
jgi:HAD superfamily hydrolase (TIGR01549 family)